MDKIVIIELSLINLVRIYKEDVGQYRIMYIYNV